MKTCTKTLFVLLIIMLWFAPSLSSKVLVVDADPTCSRAAAVNSYEIFRNNRKIGSHRVCFASMDSEWHVIAETNMKVKFLFVTAYKYQYVSEEVLVDNELKAVRAYINDNGKEWSTRATRTADGFLIEADGEVRDINDNFHTTNHWDSSVKEYDLLYNTITGKLDAVTITKADDKNSDDTDTYAVRGDLNIDTTYDAVGNWVGMQFEHKDGSLIEFRCVDCRNTPEVRT